MSCLKLSHRIHLNMTLLKLFQFRHFNGNNVERLLETIEQILTRRAHNIIQHDQVTDHPERFIISELIREKVLHLTSEEIPHSIAVVIEKIAT